MRRQLIERRMLLLAGAGRLVDIAAGIALKQSADAFVTPAGLGREDPAARTSSELCWWQRASMYQITGCRGCGTKNRQVAVSLYRLAQAYNVPRCRCDYPR